MDNLALMKKVVQLRQKAQTGALATVIRTKGSTPRKIGTKMLVYRDGKIEGTIGGGCGEAEVITEAKRVMKSNTSVCYQVDLTSGVLYEDGGICGGKMDVFIEPII